MSDPVRLRCVIRGGAAKTHRVERARCAYRVPSPADIPSADLGFRTFRRVRETLP